MNHAAVEREDGPVTGTIPGSVAIVGSKAPFRVLCCFSDGSEEQEGILPPFYKFGLEDVAASLILI